MDAPCEIQRSIHVFRLVNNMCPGKWVHINMEGFFVIVFRLVRDVVANHKTTRYAGAATKVIQKNHLA